MLVGTDTVNNTATQSSNNCLFDQLSKQHIKIQNEDMPLINSQSADEYGENHGIELR